ncbi:hypothetical protein IWX90DRAFT_412152 [Phyllosticta citrichinensis]|uniref:Uncharacterized protein n=1 Tax=Phyllosticta citrichinensis TaxID=1130410 RepID=A0ABR1Y384_9PEZI
MGTRTKRGSLHASNLSHLACLPHRAVSAPRPRATTNDDETPLPTNPTNELPLAANLDSNTPSRANERTMKRTTDRRTKPQNLKTSTHTKRAKLVLFSILQHHITSPMFDRRSPPTAATAASPFFRPAPAVTRQLSAVLYAQSHCCPSITAPSPRRHTNDAIQTLRRRDRVRRAFKSALGISTLPPPFCLVDVETGAPLPEPHSASCLDYPARLAPFPLSPNCTYIARYPLHKALLSSLAPGRQSSDGFPGFVFKFILLPRTAESPTFDPTAVLWIYTVTQRLYHTHTNRVRSKSRRH